MFNVMSNPRWVSLGSNLALFGLKARLPFIPQIIKSTVFRQFCGGINRSDCSDLVSNLNQNGVKAILDYSVEGQESEEQYDKKTASIIDSLQTVNKNEGEAFGVFKPTAIGAYSVFENALKKDSNQEINDAFERIRKRYVSIFNEAARLNVRVLIDAEETWMQDSADLLALEMMERFNSNDIIVYNTFQMYRHDRLEVLNSWIITGRNKGFKVGAKLVRGAYMEKERERALKHGYNSPICKDKKATDDNFDNAIRAVFENIDCCGLVVGSHNEASTLLTTALMKEKGIEPGDPRISFAQLFGMSDQITYNLAAQSYNAIKLIPYGPIRDVLPYLIRRAEENTSVAGQTGRELILITKELKRRRILN
jgi:proline dehydrogenase